MTIKAIAIDGPAGAGKSTVAKLVAKKLNYLYIDTGAMYRAVAWKALKQGIAMDDEIALTDIANTMDIELHNGAAGYQVLGDGMDISEEIRLPQVGKAASPVSAVLGVRKALVKKQQEMAKLGPVVMDGRDIGTKVLPDAAVKIFLTASPEERAKRRVFDFKQKGIDLQYSEVLDEINVRDNRDSSREHSPLKLADDGVLLDTSDMTIDQVVDTILDLAKKAMV